MGEVGQYTLTIRVSNLTLNYFFGFPFGFVFGLVFTVYTALKSN